MPQGGGHNGHAFLPTSQQRQRYEELIAPLLAFNKSTAGGARTQRTIDFEAYLESKVSFCNEMPMFDICSMQDLPLEPEVIALALVPNYQ